MNILRCFRLPVLYLLVSLCGSSLLRAQDTALDNDIRVFERYRNTRQPVLFLHLDKEIYNPSESISFACFAIDPGTDSVKATTLHVALIDPASGTVVAQDRFVLVAGQFSAGNLQVPDTVVEGQYDFIAFTNAMVHLSSMEPFRQMLIIKSTNRDFFRISTASIVRKKEHPDSLYWQARVITDSNGLASGALFDYQTRIGGKPLTAGKRLIDAFGEIELAIPASDSLLPGFTVSAKITRAKKTTSLIRATDLTPQRICARFYPESGHWVNGLPTRVVMSLHQPNGQAIHTTGEVYADSVPVAEFHTDLYGYGSFFCRPARGIHYSIRLDQQPADTYVTGSFPVVDSAGLVLQVLSGVVRDSMLFVVRASQPGGEYRLLVYSRSAVIYAGMFTLKQAERLIKLSTSGWPAGIVRLVVFSAKNDAVVERLLYIPPSSLLATIETDSSQYHIRSKVKVHVAVKDTAGHPVEGLFSFGTSLSARLHPTNLPDITAVVAAMYPLKNRDVLLPPSGYFTDDNAVDQVLLSSLSDYLSWNSLLNDTSRWILPHQADNFGYVRKNDRKLKTPVFLSIIGRKVFTLQTDSSGQFELPDSMLIEPFGNDPTVTVSGVGYQEAYQLYFANRYDTVTKKFALSDVVRPTLQPGTQLGAEEEVNKSFVGAKTLTAAVVVSNKDDDIPIGSGKECLDWVCINNILNCMGHYKSGTKPIVGHVYEWSGPGASPTGKIVYKRCMSCRNCSVEKVQSFLSVIPGIHLDGDFYNMDSVRFYPNQPVVYSTLYWQPFIVTNEKGEADFFFYTNDVKGRFYNRLQGLSGNRAFKGQTTITVVP